MEAFFSTISRATTGKIPDGEHVYVQMPRGFQQYDRKEMQKVLKLKKTLLDTLRVRMPTEVLTLGWQISLSVWQGPDLGIRILLREC